MTYDEYKDFLLRTLQRDGDSVLEVDLDELIRYGEAKLTRDLRQLQTIVTDESLLVTTLASTLPAAVQKITLLRVAPTGAALRATSADNIAYFQNLELADEPAMFYNVTGRTLRVTGPVPMDLLIDYQAKVPSYQDEDAQPYRDDGIFTDLYDMAVLSETPMYLKDDERTAGWIALYNAKLESANGYNDRVEWGSSPLGSMLPEGIM